MKKRPLLFVALAICILLFGGCGKGGKFSPSYTEPNKASHNEVIDRHGQVENMERLDSFVERVQAKSKDKVRLIRYTIEGDPIYHDLDFDGTTLTLTYDTTEDKFGQGEVTSYKCKSIQKQESDTETKYTLEGCPKEYMGELLYISHDVEQQDYFAFELKYGEDKKNEIDTKEQVLTKDLPNGETMNISDFQLSTDQMNRIYKQMVYANYLQPKSLANSCKDKSYDMYELNVWINDGERSYEWTSCDQSEDGLEMTNLAQTIVEIVEESL
ncbi:MAG TPA: hypothetical protein DG757_23440 [Bacillus sp. (in: Bacteria)]|nr:hypothetical protein [Bacillus sp. (in: firmicutes)]